VPVKTDLKRELATYTARLGTFAIVRVPALSYLMVDGHGDPNTSAAYAEAIGSLFPLAYRLKFLSKAELDHDYVVMPLEALWWAEDMASFTSERDKSRWDWTLMNLVPDWITEEHLHRARASMARKTGATALEAVRLERYEEGLCVQTLHVGSYDDEAPVLEAMHAYIAAQGLGLAGKHHEIYLSDARRTPPARLKTILRQPVTQASES